MDNTETNYDASLLANGTESELFVIRYHQVDAPDCNQFPRLTILFHVNHDESEFDVYWSVWHPDHEENRFEKETGRQIVLDRLHKAEDTPFHLHNIPYSSDYSLRGNLMMAMYELRNDIVDYEDGVIDVDEIEYINKVHDNTINELTRFIEWYSGIAYFNSIRPDAFSGNRFENEGLREAFSSNGTVIPKIEYVNNPLDDFIENAKYLWLRYVQVPVMKIFSG